MDDTDHDLARIAQQIDFYDRLVAADPRIRYRLANVFDFEDTLTYELIFGGFLLSQVPDSQFDAFWELRRRLLAPGGSVVFVDSRASGPGGGGARRRLSDGREFDIVKVRHALPALKQRLSKLDWQASISSPTDNIYRVEAEYGSGRTNR